MGLFSGLVTLPLAPVRGAAWVTKQVADEADRQLYDEDQIRREMLQLEIDYDEGKIGDEERAREEDALFERLEVARERRREDRLEAEALEEGALEGEVIEEETLMPEEHEEEHPDSEERW
jgi:Gas vesicle protein G